MDPKSPYSLKPGGGTSDDYYHKISAFTDQWTRLAREEAGDIASGFRRFQAAHGRPVRSIDECTFELLALGVLMREHGFEAISLPDWTVRLLQRLLKLQDGHPRAEVAFKILRGAVSGLVGGLGKGRRYEGLDHGQRFVGSREAVSEMIVWLAAQGQAAQAERLADWRDYFYSLDLVTSRRQIQRAQRLADRFVQESSSALGEFTRMVEDYVDDAAPEMLWRYDAALVTRSRVEYHLGMLGTEVLNRAYRERYLQSERRMVIVPTCLRTRPDGECQAVKTPAGAVCQGCTPTCHAFHVTKLGQKYHVPVLIIPDDELANVCVSSGQAGTGVGVVGLSCALTNWSAGWTAEMLGLNAQGVLLDCAGCKKHWSATGVSTEANLNQIRAVLGLD